MFTFSIADIFFFFFFQAEDGIRDLIVTGVQTCALPISRQEEHDVGDRLGSDERVSRRPRADRFERPLALGDHVPDVGLDGAGRDRVDGDPDRKSTRLNSSHDQISYAVFCLKKKKSNGASPTRLSRKNGGASTPERRRTITQCGVRYASRTGRPPRRPAQR